MGLDDDFVTDLGLKDEDDLDSLRAKAHALAVECKLRQSRLDDSEAQKTILSSRVDDLEEMLTKLQEKLKKMKEFEDQNVMKSESITEDDRKAATAELREKLRIAEQQVNDAKDRIFSLRVGNRKESGELANKIAGLEDRLKSAEERHKASIADAEKEAVREQENIRRQLSDRIADLEIALRAAAAGTP